MLSANISEMPPTNQPCAMSLATEHPARSTTPSNRKQTLLVILAGGHSCLIVLFGGAVNGRLQCRFSHVRCGVSFIFTKPYPCTGERATIEDSSGHAAGQTGRRGGGETKHKRSGMAVNRTAVVELSIFSGKVFIGQLPILLGRSS